jgi:hypothetical protein
LSTFAVEKDHPRAKLSEAFFYNQSSWRIPESLASIFHWFYFHSEQDFICLIAYRLTSSSVFFELIKNKKIIRGLLMSITRQAQSRMGFAYKRRAVFIAISMSSIVYSVNSQAQPVAPEIEEVIVTGSFIRRSEGLNAASPVTLLSAEDLEAQGTVNMAQVIQNLTFNNGTAVTNSIQGVVSTTSNFNLRGLGPRATLTLIDGKRIATDNVQSMLPASALQRMEVVTDGAAALYGSDAGPAKPPIKNPPLKADTALPR